MGTDRESRGSQLDPLSDGVFDAVSLDVIDPPAEAVRLTIDPAGIADLARSIRQNGLIEPLVVAPRGARFEVIAGHRRYLACREAGLIYAPCRIVPDGATAVEAIRIAENVDREPLNVAEEAVYYARIEERVAGDLEQVCRLVKRTPDYVSARLRVLHGDPDVFEALAGEEIGLGVALALNTIPDVGRRRMFLESAVRSGTTLAQLRQQIADSLAAHPASMDTPPAPVTLAGHAGEEPLPAGPVCFWCQDDEMGSPTEILYLHRHCLRSVRKAIAARLTKES